MKMSKPRLFPSVLLFPVAALLLTVPLEGASYSINPNALDAGVRSNGVAPNTVVNQGDFAVRVGELFAPDSISLILPFLLPTLPDGEAITTANLRTQLFGKPNEGNLGNVDLYGLGYRSAADVLVTDFYSGMAVDTTDATIIMQGYMTPSTPVRIDQNTDFVNTDVAGDIALVNYLNAQYTAGAVGGDYVFLRLSYAVNPPIPGGNSAYEVLTENAGGANEKPLLTFETAVIPEPSSALLLLGGLTVLVCKRRRA